VLTRLACCALGWVALAVPATAQPSPPREDATKAEAEKLRAQAQALLTQAQALEAQARQARADREAAEKYLREFADSCLEPLLKGDARDIVPLLSKEMKDYWGPPNNLDVVQGRGVAVSGYKITGTAIAPSGDEAIFGPRSAGRALRPMRRGKTRRPRSRSESRRRTGGMFSGF
jgi:hypothetical protein